MDKNNDFLYCENVDKENNIIHKVLMLIKKARS